ncbi:hypothetical protein CHARACLAT_030334 [Characodon lateralis]|uniref:Uncharacterized protein n=1 Tax=Characodon lateralis TaxID=208331 RepID=A0ABU7F8G7_9TELE|nr:hypothetical protein [Characodon lateralis]
MSRNIKFVEKILEGQHPVFPAGHKDVEMLRWHTAVTVLEASDDLTDICCICGQKDDPKEKKSIIWVGGTSGGWDILRRDLLWRAFR